MVENTSVSLNKKKNKISLFLSDMKETLSPRNNVHELVTLKVGTKSLLLVLLIAQAFAFIVGKDFSVMGWIGLVTGVATIINLVLVDQGRLTNYSWGLLSSAVWFVVALSNHLIGDIASQSFYFIMQFVGVYAWKRQLEKQDDQTEIGSKKMTLSQKFGALVLTIVIYLAVLFVSHSLHGTQIYLDATLLPLGIVGQILMTYDYQSQWVAWISLDVVNVIIWFNQLGNGGVSAMSMFVLQVIMLINAFYGAYQWSKK